MRSERRFAQFRIILTCIFMAVFCAATAWAAPQYKVLHAFGGSGDGAGLYGGVVFDQQGRLYGTSSGGGTYQYGTVWPPWVRKRGGYVTKWPSHCAA
jgi:hypothetical protein